MSEECIMARMQEHLAAVQDQFGDSWVGLFLQGSQNYKLDYEDSDILQRLCMCFQSESIHYGTVWRLTRKASLGRVRCALLGSSGSTDTLANRSSGGYNFSIITNKIIDKSAAIGYNRGG